MDNKIYRSSGSMRALIVAGYLGSGKTTLLKRILDGAEGSGHRIAVLENEFGSVGMDGQILKRQGVELREVAGGCVCCTQQGRLVQELSVLAEMGIETVFIEASGVADPNGIAAELFEPALFGKVSRGPGIAVIDGVNALGYKDEEIAAMQLAFADLVYISKAEAESELKGWIGALNPEARVFSNEEHVGLIRAVLEEELSKKAFPKVGDGTNHGFVTVSFESEVPFDRELFRYAMNHILKQGDCYRVKGVVKGEKAEESFYFESVGFYGEEKGLDYVGLDKGEIPSESRLVFIGKQLDESAIRKAMTDALVSA